MNRNGPKPQRCPHGTLGKSKCQKCRVAKVQRWRERNPNHGRAYTRARSGVPVEDGKTKIDECPLCHKVRKLVPDHNHKTMKLRGWICVSCNCILGMYETYRHMFAIFRRYLRETDKTYLETVDERE